MKIAVLSDIHGNNVAFDAVLADIKNEHADQILILGDSISDFPQATREVLDKVRNCGTFVIRGNREKYMIDQSNDEYGNTWQEYEQFSSTLHTWNQLREDDIRYLKSLPTQISITYNNDFTLRMVHGSPFAESDGLLEEETESIARALNSIPEKILLCGHTHLQMIKQIDGKTIINPGSVGNNFIKESSAQYAIIEQNNDDLLFIIKKVPYDLEAFKSTCDMNNVWVRLCIKSIEDGINYIVMFLDEAARRWNLWPIPNEFFNVLVDEWTKKGIL